ncbi:MAG: hypothetical protein MKZ54_05105 [Candidatus Poseidoniaceae archaeon]|nr:hypothetical protein [Candidatus Poseidoniaceae archaeon]
MDRTSLEAIVKSNDESALARELHDMLLSTKKYERLVAEGASVMLRRNQQPSHIAKSILDGKIESPRMYNRKVRVSSGRLAGAELDLEILDYFEVKRTGEGDFYVDRVGPNAGRVSRERTGPNQYAVSVRDPTKLDPMFLFYNFDAIFPFLNRMTRGTAQHTMRKSDIDLAFAAFQPRYLERQIDEATAQAKVNAEAAVKRFQEANQKGAGPRRDRVFFRKFDVKDASRSEEATVNEIIDTYFTAEERREFHKKGVNLRVEDLPEDIAGQNRGREVIFDPDTLERNDGITEDVVVHEMIHAQNRFREEQNPSIYLRKESIIDGPREIKNDTEIEEAITEAMTTARLSQFDDTSGLPIPTAKGSLKRRYNRHHKDEEEERAYDREIDYSVSIQDLPEAERIAIEVALRNRFIRTPPNELTYEDNGFRYRLEETIPGALFEEPRYVYAIVDERGPKNLDEMREFADTTIEVGLQELMDGEAVYEYSWDGLNQALDSNLADVNSLIDVQKTIDRAYDFRARSIPSERQNAWRFFNPKHPEPIGFEVDGQFITDPFTDETSRFQVNPIDYYGQDFIDFLEQYPVRGVPFNEDLTFSGEPIAPLPPVLYVLARSDGPDDAEAVDDPRLVQTIVGVYDNQADVLRQEGQLQNYQPIANRPIDTSIMTLSGQDWKEAIWDNWPFYFEREGVGWVKESIGPDRYIRYRSQGRMADGQMYDDTIAFDAYNQDASMIQRNELWNRIVYPGRSIYGRRFNDIRRISGKEMARFRTSKNRSRPSFMNIENARKFAKIARIRGYNARVMPTSKGANVYLKRRV